MVTLTSTPFLLNCKGHANHHKRAGILTFINLIKRYRFQSLKQMESAARKTEKSLLYSGLRLTIYLSITDWRLLKRKE